MTHYTIRLKNCSFLAHHGLYEEEKRLGQRFYVDVVLDMSCDANLADDAIEGTVDYGDLFQVIERIMKGEQRNLIETLAHEIAATLCAEYPIISKACVTVRKPSAPIQGVLDYVEVSYTHAQND